MSAFGPLGSYPLGATPTNGISRVAVAMSADGNSLGVARNVILGRLGAHPTASGSKNAMTALHEAVSADSSLAVVWRMLIDADITVAGAAASSLRRLAQAIDYLHASGAAASSKDAKAAVASVLAINGLIATGWKVTAAGSAEFTDAFNGHLVAVTRLVGAATAAGSTGATLRLTAIVAESLQADNDLATTMDLLATAREDVIVYTAIRLGDSEYVGWVLNDGTAPSQYTNYPFNGFVEFPPGSKRYVGTASDGVYLLEGDTDDGDAIDTRIQTGVMDFGTGVLKRMPTIYVAFAGGNKLVCKVTTVHPRTGAQTETIYTATVPAGAGLHTAPIKTGQGLESRYWQFELSNVGGADFDLDELTFRPLVLDRRI
jgi:hypothetical protein